MIKQLTQRIGKGICDAKSFMGNAYHQGSKFLGTVDRYAGIARKVIGAVAPVAGALTGPTGAAVGAAVSLGMKGLSGPDESGDAGGAGGETRPKVNNVSD